MCGSQELSECQRGAVMGRQLCNKTGRGISSVPKILEQSGHCSSDNYRPHVAFRRALEQGVQSFMEQVFRLSVCIHATHHQVQGRALGDVVGFAYVQYNITRLAAVCKVWRGGIMV